MHPARIYINDSLSYTRQFIETRKRTLTVTLKSLEYKIGSYITHGRLEGDMGFLPTTFGYHAEKETDKVLRIVTSRPDIRRICGKAISFQFTYAGLALKHVPKVQVAKVSSSVSVICLFTAVNPTFSLELISS